MKVKIIKSKKSIRIILFFSVITAIAISSCKKEENLVESKVLANEIAGKYTGLLKDISSNESNDAILDVVTINDTLIQMNCVSDDIDTIFYMQLYQNNDSIMICNIGQDFFNEYGHYTDHTDFCNNQNTDWMNENWNEENWTGNSDWNAWTNHLNTQHIQKDEHYGGFDTNSNTCEIRIKTFPTDDFIIKKFSGFKIN